MEIGTRYGLGTYFAVKLQYASHYGSVFFISRVLTGICKPYDRNDPRHLSHIQGSNTDRIHSVIANDGQIYIVFNDNAAYPEYMLHVKPSTFGNRRHIRSVHSANYLY